MRVNRHAAEHFLKQPALLVHVDLFFRVELPSDRFDSRGTRCELATFLYCGVRLWATTCEKRGSSGQGLSFSVVRMPVERDTEA